VRAERAPDRVVLQYIQGQVYRWHEYDLHPTDRSRGYYIVVQKPFEKALTLDEAEVLINASLAWEYVEADPTAMLHTDKEGGAANRLGNRATNRGVIGNDDRTKIDIDVSRNFPYTNVAALRTRFEIGQPMDSSNPPPRPIISSLLVAPGVALTSVSNVYSAERDEIAFIGQVYPGSSTSPVDHPFTPYAFIAANNIKYFDEYFDDPSAAFDCAGLLLGDTFDNIIAYVPIVADLSPTTLTVLGYPMSVNGIDQEYAMWRGDGDLVAITDNGRIIQHTADTSPGTQGGPIWAYDGISYRVVGIQSSVDNFSTATATVNEGFRFRNDETLNVINEWMEHSLSTSPSTPENNFFVTSILINGESAKSGSVRADNIGACCPEPNEPNHHNLNPPTNESSVWWRYRTNEPGTLVINTNSSQVSFIDTVMAAYTGTSLNDLQLIASDNDNGFGNASELVFGVVPDVTYHIAVASVDNNTGTFMLNWDLVPYDIPGDSNEDNDTYEQATEVPLRGSMFNQVLQDDDWFKLIVPPDEHMVIDIAFDHELGDINAQLYDRRGAFEDEPFAVEVAAGYSTTDNERLTYVNTTGADFLYLRIYGEQGATNPVYSFVQNFIFRDDALEFLNDGSCYELLTIQPNNSYFDLVLRDDDWYRVPVTGLSQLHVVLEHEYFSGDLDIMITRDRGVCDAYNDVIALGNTHDPRVVEQVSADVSGLDSVLIRVYGEQRQKNFYNLVITGE
jgi:V8-like Glu-specific endopeptidase